MNKLRVVGLVDAVLLPLPAVSWLADLLAAGVDVVEEVIGCDALVQAVVCHAPDVVMVISAQPADALFQALAKLDAVRPSPVLLFTESLDTALMVRAVAAPVHGYEVRGYAPERLLPLLQLTCVRFAHVQSQRKAMQDLEARWHGRVTVNKAKGILMQSQRMSDDQAFGLLRSTSMNHSQRLEELARKVVAAAGHAEQVNRCGQLRMLSQRVAKLQLLAVLRSGLLPAQVEVLQRTIGRVETNLAWLDAALAHSAHASMLVPVHAAWAETCLAMTPVSPSPGVAAMPVLARLDVATNHLLVAADTLAAALQTGSGAAPLGWLNTVGRQRMLCQLYAKQVLLRCLLEGEAADHAQAVQQDTRQAFEKVLTDLNRLPLSSPAIETSLLKAGADWLGLVHAGQRLLVSTPRVRRQTALDDVFATSESVLESFETLSTHYETSLELLLG